jgi:hypothetical protein
VAGKKGLSPLKLLKDLIFNKRHGKSFWIIIIQTAFIIFIAWLEVPNILKIQLLFMEGKK